MKEREKGDRGDRGSKRERGRGREKGSERERDGGMGSSSKTHTYHKSMLIKYTDKDIHAK